jgi:hypothetical protein
MDYNPRQQRHRAERAYYPHHLALWVHPALSGLHSSESCQNNLDGQFIFLLIAFNADNSQDLECLNVTEAARFLPFVSQNLRFRTKKVLTKLVWVVYPNSSRIEQG